MDNTTIHQDFREVFITDVNYIHPFEWEHINLTKCRRWMADNWTLSVFASAVYIILIFAGQSWMKNRPAFQLRKLLVAWNIGLAIFSIIGFIRTVPELVHINGNFGFHFSICIREHHNTATAFWGWMMAWSKLVELGDTAFIVLRKQPLIFLHWYHHITVLIYTWATYGPYDPPLRYFMTINLFVHGIMYSYYALRAMQIKIPRNWAMLITTLQLSQMVVGVTINVYSLWLKGSDSVDRFKGSYTCDRDYDGIYAALSMYASYFLLFTHFFYRAYLANAKSSSQKLKSS